MDLILNYIELFTNIFKSIGIVPNIFLISLEAIFPMLPLSLFITLNINAYGFFFGFIISWSATVMGCYLSFFISKTIINKLILKLLSTKSKRILNVWKSKIENIPFTYLVIIISLPFTPSCLINFASGFVNMDNKKFLLANIIGKVFIVYFWGFVGACLITSMTNIKTIFIVLVMLVMAYMCSKYVSRKVDID